MSSTRDKYADLYAALRATAETGGTVRVPLRGREARTVRFQTWRHLATRGYRLHAERDGDALVCRAEHIPPLTLTPAYSPVRVLSGEGTLVRMLSHDELRARPRIERVTTDYAVAHRRPDDIAPTVPYAQGGASWALNSF